MGEVIEFPKNEKTEFHQDPINAEAISNAHTIVHFAVDLLNDCGYDVNNEKTVKDLGMIANFLYATMVRARGEEHVLGEVMDDIQNELTMLKKILDDIN